MSPGIRRPTDVRPLKGITRSLSVVVGVSAIVFFAGCGDSGRKTAHLQGTVTLGGQAIPTDAESSISFRIAAAGQGRSVSARIVDGKYDSPNTPLGAVKVFFGIQQPTGKMAHEGIGNPYPEYRSLVPTKHAQGIDQEVTGDNLNQNFDL